MITVLSATPVLAYIGQISGGVPVPGGTAFVPVTPAQPSTGTAVSLPGMISVPNEIGMGEAIRVGLVSRGERASIDILSNTLSVGFHDSYNFSIEAALNVPGTLAASRTNSAYVRIAQDLPDFSLASAAASNFSGNQRAVPVLMSPSNWSVYIGGFANFGEAEVVAGQVGGTAIAPSPTRVAITESGYAVVIFENSERFAHFADPSGITAIDSGRYRGVIEPFVREGRFTAVNVVNMEDYLKSVVPSEMPASWHVEALKAQAVAARTFAATRLNTHAADGWQLGDTVFTQVYRGVEAENENSTRAVLETRGIMAFHEGRPINAVYFSSSGGHTENSENVWLTATPYLRAVPELAETGYMQWTRSYTMAQITSFMAANGHNIGTVNSVSYATAPGSGRVIGLTFNGTNGTRTYTNDAIRGAFRESSQGSLPSTNFTIANTTSTGYTPAVPEPAIPFIPDVGYIEITDANGVTMRLTFSGLQPTAAVPAALPALGASGTTTTATFAITGRGWGHGAGMSQFGARGMAEAGYTFDQILKHYYTGIEVR